MGRPPVDPERLAALAARLYPRELRGEREDELRDALLDAWDDERDRHPRAYRLTAILRLATDLVAARRALRRRRQNARPPVRREDSRMSTLLHDLRFVLRSLLRRPAFLAGAVLLLGVGIAANVALWSVVHSVLLRPLPYGEPDRVVTLWSEWSTFDKTWLSMEEARLYRDQIDVLEDFAIVGAASASFDDLDHPERTHALGVSASMLSVLGVEPRLGRPFTAEEAREGRDVVILSSELWQRRYGADPALLGATVGIEGRRHDVVGILPAGLDVPQDLAMALHADVWFPLDFPEGTVELGHGGGSHNYYGVGRLRPGATVAELQTQLDAHVARLSEEGVYPETMRFRVNAEDAAQEVVGGMRRALVLFTVAVFLVLLVAAFNVAGLAITEGLRRSDELAVRGALGATRGRLMFQGMLEAAAIALLAGVAGVAAAWGALALFRRYAPTELPRLDGVGLNGFSLAVAGLLTALAAALFGLWPTVVASRRAVTASRRVTADRGGRRARTLVTTAQVALSLVLLVGTGLMARSLAGLLAVDPGFATREALTWRVYLPRAHFPESDLVIAGWDRMVESLRGEPGVVSAAAVRLLPLASTMGDFGVRVDGYQPPPGEHPSAEWQSITPGYFSTLGIPLLAGRDFDRGDGADSAQVVIVNQAFVRSYVPDREALGRAIYLGGGDTPITIVGVVADVRHNGILATAKPTWYRPHTQFESSTGFTARAMTVVARTERDASTMTAAARRAVDAADPRLAIGELATLREVIGGQVSASRFSTFVLVLFAGTALLLATLGILGVVSHLARQRKREIAIRMAIGARPVDALHLVLRQGAAMVLAGIAVGLAATVLATRSLRGLLYGVEPLDPSTFAVALPVILVAGLIACSIPAWRAARTQPLTSLREE
ncbi:MAG TPA: ABC transporter permease [Thermoanaerobaculia bacterium]|nr:ABC transporter permease [Thermoanaerobaculia bacterium]